MILKAVTVRNYRIHRELQVELDPARTLIGGPNESGKSTLIEAAHRALFLKAKITGEVQRGMLSWNAQGHPEVEVQFTIGDRDYRVVKRFAGQSGTVRLTEVGGATWSGEEAEERLAGLLGAEDSLGGRGASRANNQWSHIWVWQGQAGEDPTRHATDHRDELMARLQRSGGAAVLQSALDARVAEAVDERHAELFTSHGGVKRGSPLQKAEAALEEAEGRLREARAAVVRLESASVDLSRAQAALAGAEAALPGLTKELAATRLRAQQVEQLKSECDRLALQVKAADSHYQSLVTADARIAEARSNIRELELKLEPRVEALRVLEAGTQAALARAQELEAARRVAAERARASRQMKTGVDGYVRYYELEKERLALEEKQVEIGKLRAELEQVEARLRPLPEIKPAKLRRLEELERTRGELKATLEGMATGIEVLSAGQVIRLGDEDLSAGASRVLLDEAEVVIGGDTRLRIRPGGGNALTEARSRLAEAETDLSDLYQVLGVRSALEAQGLRAQRMELEADLKVRRLRLEDRGADTLADELETARTAWERARGELERNLDSLGAGFEPPTGLSEARERAEALKLEVAEANRAETASEEELTRARDAETQLGTQLEGARGELQKDQNALQQLRGQLQVHLESHGEDEARGVRLREGRAAKVDAETQLSGRQSQLAELQPELLESDLKRLETALDQTREQRVRADRDAAVALSALRLDGTVDPEAAVAVAEGACERAREAHAREQRGAEAVRLLHQLFVEEQRRLAERFTEPLAERISDYLRPVYGAGTAARIVVEANAFSGIEIVRRDRGENAMPFEPLSGGTKEQVAVAVRLAIAEILAEEHGGHLPVVLDDAFAYSDHDRIKNVQRMLYLAAERGLQVIVLTCTPEDYLGLGARQIMLGTPAFSAPARRAIVPEDADTDGEEEMNTAPPGGGALSPSNRVDVAEGHRRALLELLDPTEGRGNITLRQVLGWDTELYEAVKQDLLRTGRAVAGKGRGGTLRATGRG